MTSRGPKIANMENITQLYLKRLTSPIWRIGLGQYSSYLANMTYWTGKSRIGQLNPVLAHFCFLYYICSFDHICDWCVLIFHENRLTFQVDSLSRWWYGYKPSDDHWWLVVIRSDDGHLLFCSLNTSFAILTPKPDKKQTFMEATG